MKVEFTKNHVGHKAGSVAEMPTAKAEYLVKMGVVVFAVPEMPIAKKEYKKRGRKPKNSQ